MVFKSVRLHMMFNSRILHQLHRTYLVWCLHSQKLKPGKMKPTNIIYFTCDFVFIVYFIQYILIIFKKKKILT